MLLLVFSGWAGVGHGTGNGLTVDGVVGALAQRNDLDGGRSLGGSQSIADPEPWGNASIDSIVSTRAAAYVGHLDTTAPP